MNASLIRVSSLALFLGAFPLRADIVSIPISADLDAEFAHAADLLEAGDRREAERLLTEIVARSGQTAWKARVAVLLASDDLRRKEWKDAIRQLKDAPTSVIGLEPYRHLRLARALVAVGKWEEAQAELSKAFETDEPFAFRAEAGIELARALEKRADPADALRVLARSAAIAPTEEAARIGEERIRLARALKNQPAVRAAAADMISAGVDGPSAAARRAIDEELSRATPSVRARFARARIAAGDAHRGANLLKAETPSRWPPDERAANLLALARAFARLRDPRGAERLAARVPQDGTPASSEARLEWADLVLARLRKKGPPTRDDPELIAVRQGLLKLLSDPTPEPVRIAARERVIRIAADRDDFGEGLEQARQLVRESPDTSAGFEPLWRLVWKSYIGGDFAITRERLTHLTPLYTGVSIGRRLSYWTARCLERQGQGEQAKAIYRDLAAADPADLYALFSRRRLGNFQTRKPSPVPDPSVATATFRRTDELLRLRLFSEAAAEALALPRSRGRELRVAEAEFALGRFPVAVAAAKRAFPEMGTAGEGRVPDPWRRLYYPIEEGGYLIQRAAEFNLDPALLRGLVRQESIFEVGARSRAGALGLMQLMPATAKSLSRSVLRQRYRKAFLYDPKINSRLGAAYFRRLLDSFGGNTVYALAAYNGGPGRMTHLLKENGDRSEDEVFESHPAFETRDYVRRVLLFAEAYRGLYP